MTGKPKREERFTMLEEKGPNTLPPGAENWPVVEFVDKQRFTMLEGGEGSEPAIPAALPSTVVSLAAQLADALAGLDAGARAAALAYLTAEVGKRQAG